MDLCLQISNYHLVGNPNNSYLPREPKKIKKKIF